MEELAVSAKSIYPPGGTQLPTPPFYLPLPLPCTRHYHYVTALSCLLLDVACEPALVVGVGFLQRGLQLGGQVLEGRVVGLHRHRRRVVHVGADIAVVRVLRAPHPAPPVPQQRSATQGSELTGG